MEALTETEGKLWKQQVSQTSSAPGKALEDAGSSSPDDPWEKYALFWLSWQESENVPRRVAADVADSAAKIWSSKSLHGKVGYEYLL